MAPIDFDYLALISDNDREFEAELLSVYITDSEKHLNLATQAILESDYSSLAKESHHLKGASGNVGAIELQALAQELEDDAKSQNLDSAKEKIDRMMEQFTVIKQLFQVRYGDQEIPSN